MTTRTYRIPGTDVTLWVRVVEGVDDDDVPSVVTGVTLVLEPGRTVRIDPKLVLLGDEVLALGFDEVLAPTAD